MSIKYLSISAFMFFFRVMLDTGAVFCGTGANDASTGATAWTNPTNLTADDNNTASCNAAATSQYLVGKNFGFTIPHSATILGITVTIGATESSSGTETFFGQLQNESGALFGNQKSVTLSGTSEATYTYGSATDIWGLANNTIPQTITSDITNDADFGIRMNFSTAHNVTVDWCKMQINYALGGAFFMMTRTGKFHNQNKVK